MSGNESIGEDECIMFGSIPTGLEFITREEIKKKLGVKEWGKPIDGRVYFILPVNQCLKSLEIKTFARISVLVAKRVIPTDERFLDYLENDFIPQLDWKNPLQVFYHFFPEKKELFRWKKSGNEEQDDNDQTRPSFRVTCSRCDENSNPRHTFTSMEAASKFGSGINNYFGWRVDLSNSDIEILLHITGNNIVVSIQVAHVLHRRHIHSLGPTALVGTISYSLNYLAKIQPGLSIPIEGAIEWPNCFYLGGEKNSQGAQRSQNNLNYLKIEKGHSYPISVLQWDATDLPLRNQSVDVFLCDLPFGKKMGSRIDNKILYPLALNEMARVCRQGTGRVVLLAHDKSIMKVYLRDQERVYWIEKKSFIINHGGLRVSVWVLNRTNEEYIKKEKKEKKMNQKQINKDETNYR